MITVTATLSGTVNSKAITAGASYSVEPSAISQFVRDVSNTVDVLSAGDFVMAIICNEGNDTLCVTVGKLNFAVPAGKHSVITGSNGKYDSGSSTYSSERVGSISARSLTSAGTRVKMFVVR